MAARCVEEEGTALNSRPRRHHHCLLWLLGLNWLRLRLLMPSQLLFALMVAVTVETEWVT